MLIQKGFALTTCIIASLCFIFGIGTSICAWVLSGKNVNWDQSTNSVQSSYSITQYWWGGVVYAAPGILGIVAGCTRNTTAMVFYLVFNLLSMIASCVVSILVIILIAAWASLNTAVQSDSCVTFGNTCLCANSQIKVYNISCDDLNTIQVLLGAIIAMAGLSSVLSFVGSYVSCCALCNQEHPAPTVIVSHGGGGGSGYQPSTIVVSNNSSQMMAGGQPYMPQGYPNQGYPNQGYPNQGYPNQGYPIQEYPNRDQPPAYNTDLDFDHDKRKLMKSEVI